MTGSRLLFGIETNYVSDIQVLLDSATENNDFFLLPLFHPRNRRDNRANDDRDVPMTRSDMLLPSHTWHTKIMGKISEWIDLDNECTVMRIRSETVLKQEIAWARHLGVPVILPPPLSPHSPNYSRVLQHVLQISPLFIRIPLTAPFNYRSHTSSNGYALWDNLRHATQHSPNLGIALEITDVPDDATLIQWHAEPIRALILPISIYLINKGGFPVLSKQYQHLLLLLLTHHPRIIITGHSDKPLNYYYQYIAHLYRKSQEGVVADLAPYYDILQAPLQPLMDNLESVTYETFERDPTKYNQYQLAITNAMLQLQEQDVVVTVVGAGRGPLVACTLAAAAAANKQVRVFAVEKNPNAIITLRNRAITESWSNVTIIATDMRLWEPSELCDILVSELLGSIGDNELSPECLDGAQKCLKNTGISIPTSYLSYIAPITSAKCWTSAKTLLQEKGLDTPFVVKLHNFFPIDVQKPLFYFEHPNRSERIDNDRYATVEFVSSVDATMHGFIGTFDSVLFGDVHISITEHNHTEGMFSWFPMFIPLRVPIQVKSGEKITAHFWRCSNSVKVWYEWSISSPQVSVIQNSGGSSYWIGLQT